MTTGILAAEGGLVDRQMMVLDSTGKMITVCKYPHMTLVQLSLPARGWRVAEAQLPGAGAGGEGEATP